MRITLQARMKSGILLEAARKIGSAKALAVKFGVAHSTMVNWIGLKDAPSKKTIERRWAEWEIALFEVLGRPIEIDTVFPPGLRDQLMGRATLIEETRDVGVAWLTGADARPRELQISTQEVRQAIARLSPRDAQVIEALYGFDGKPKTLREVGDVLNVSAGRIAELRARAERKLKAILAPVKEGGDELASKDVVDDAERVAELLCKKERTAEEDSFLLVQAARRHLRERHLR